MRVLIVAEYYPRAQDPTSGIWAHRQALAARDAGRRGPGAGPAPAAAAAGGGPGAGPRGGRAGAGASGRGSSSTAWRFSTCATSRRPGRGAMPRWGAWAAPLAAAGHGSDPPYVPVRPRARPLRRPRRRRGPPGGAGRSPARVGARRRRARSRTLARPACSARSPTPAWCWPTAPARRDGAWSTARGRRPRGWCTSGPTCRTVERPEPGRGRIARSPHAGHRRQPDRAQAPRRRDRGAPRAARAPSRACDT